MSKIKNGYQLHAPPGTSFIDIFIPVAACVVAQDIEADIKFNHFDYLNGTFTFHTEVELHPSSLRYLEREGYPTFLLPDKDPV